MKELVFPKDQELFQGIDEKGEVIPFSGPDTMAARYESSLEFYRSLNDTVHVSGSSEEELERDLSNKLRQIRSSQWESLDQVVEDASQDPIGRFPKTSYDLYLYISKRDKSRQSVTMNHFFELDQALQLYDKDLAPSGPLGKLFNEVEKKARQLRELRTKRRKLLLELPVIALQILAALLVEASGFRFVTGTESTRQILLSFAFLAFLLLGLLVPALSKVHDKNTFSGLLFHPVAVIAMVIVSWCVLGGLLVDDDILSLAFRVLFFGFYGLLVLSDLGFLLKYSRLRRKFRPLFAERAQAMYRYIRLRVLWWKNVRPGDEEPKGLQRLQKMFRDYQAFCR